MAVDGSVGGVRASSAGAAPMLDEQSASAVPDFDPSAQSGYMTSGEIMAWLAVVGGNTYDEMRRQMVGTEQRRELQKDLTSLKALVEEAKTTKDPDKLQADDERTHRQVRRYSLRGTSEAKRWERTRLRSCR